MNYANLSIIWVQLRTSKDIKFDGWFLEAEEIPRGCRDYIKKRHLGSNFSFQRPTYSGTSLYIVIMTSSDHRRLHVFLPNLYGTMNRPPKPTRTTAETHISHLCPFLPLLRDMISLPGAVYSGFGFLLYYSWWSFYNWGMLRTLVHLFQSSVKWYTGGLSLPCLLKPFLREM